MVSLKPENFFINQNNCLEINFKPLKKRKLPLQNPPLFVTLAILLKYPTFAVNMSKKKSFTSKLIALISLFVQTVNRRK